MPRVLSRGQFQIFAIATLIVAHAVWLELCVRAVPPIPWLAPYIGVVLAWLVTWVLIVIAWMVAVFPVRAMSDMPAMRLGTLESALAEQARLRAAETSSDPKERRRRHLGMAGAALALTFALGFVSAANVELAPDHVLLFPIVGAGMCAVMVPYFALRGLRAR